MNVHDAYALFMSLAAVGAGAFLARNLYRYVIFRITAEHRDVVLSSAYLLDEKHELNEREEAIVAGAIAYLFDYGVKARIVRDTLREWDKLVARRPSQMKIREEVRTVQMASAAIMLYENPVYALRLLMKVVEQAKNTKAPKRQSPLARAESVVAEKAQEAGLKRVPHAEDLAFC
jgi:hypothetical protein